MDIMLEILKNFGPWCALVSFLIWQTAKREDRMGKALDLQNKQLLGFAERLAALVGENIEINRSLIRILRDRPCITVDEPSEQQKPYKRTKSDPEIRPAIRPRPSLPETDRLPRTA